METMEFGLAVDRSRAPYTTLTVTGEVDVYTSPRLREKLAELLSEGHRRIVLDLSEVDFMDSTGLGVLVAGLKRARASNGDLTLVCSDPIVILFEMTGLTEVFTVFSSVEKATIG